MSLAETPADPRSAGHRRAQSCVRLTILGMTMGVAAVIILVAVGNGSKKAVQPGSTRSAPTARREPQLGPGGPGRVRAGRAPASR